MKGATSGWAVFFLAMLVLLLAAVAAATGLDLLVREVEEQGDGVGQEEGERVGEGEAAAEPLLPVSSNGQAPEDGAGAVVRATGSRPSASKRWSKRLAAARDALRVLSLKRNLPKLLQTPAQAAPTDCLNGMRVLSMVGQCRLTPGTRWCGFQVCSGGV
jgi:hypothetical protein